MGMEMDTLSGSVQGPLKLVQGPLLTNEEYIRAVEAAVVAVGRGAGAGRDARDWSIALKRLLLVRRSPPLALWWAFSCVECGAVLGFKGGLEEASGLVSSVSGLVQSLKSLSIGNADHATAIAVLAPVLSAVYEVTQLISRSVGMLGKKGLSEGEEGIGKKRRKIARRLRELIREVLTFLVLCRKWEFDAFDTLPGPPVAPDFGSKFGSLLAAENVKGVSPHPSAFITFPVSSTASKVLGAGENVSAKELADVLCAEVVLLQLLVEIIDWRSRLKKQKKNFEPGSHELVGKLKHIAVHAAATAGSSGSSEALVEMLLDARLPVGDVLDTQEEAVLRGVLYEAVFLGPPVHDVPPQDLSLFMKKVAVGRLAVTLFRSKNEHNRAAAIQDKLMCIAPPPHFLEWLNTTANGQKPLLGAVHEMKTLGWLVRSVDESTFRMLLDKCEQSERHPRIDEMAIATEADGEEDMFFIDKKGNMGADIDEDQLISDVADRAFASAARHISGSDELVAAHSSDEVNGKFQSVEETEPEKSGSGADSDSEMEGDGGRRHGNGSGSKRPRDEAFAQAILLLSSSEESEDDVIEVSERDAQRVKQDSKGQHLGSKLPRSKESTPSVVEVKGQQGKELKEDSLARNGDEEMLEGQADVGGHTVEALRKNASSCEVAEAKGLQVEDGKDTSIRLQIAKPMCTLNQSGQISEDKHERFLDRLESHGDEKRIVEPSGSEDLNQSDQGTLVPESGGKQKAKRVNSLKENGDGSGGCFVTPKRRYVTRAKPEDEECVKHLQTPEKLDVKEQTRPQTPEPCKVFDTCVTPSNTGSKLRKRQTETTPDVYQPRVTRSGKVLGVSHSVEKSTKKTRKGKAVALQPIFDSNGE